MYVFSPIGLLSVSLRCPVKDFTDIENAEILKKCMFFSKEDSKGFVHTSRPHPRGNCLCRFEGVPPSTQVGHLRTRKGGVASDGLFYAGETPTPPVLPLPPQKGDSGGWFKEWNKWRGDTKGELPLPPQRGGQMGGGRLRDGKGRQDWITNDFIKTIINLLKI